MTGPRLTGWGIATIVVHVGLPLVAALLALDLLFYLVFTRVLGRCYGLLCWLD
ncbi:hypothetical protein [Benzoatithermus flavus]|uniref:Uncharacterized protein n=1 Tax=Benzoatithermus flavus TaxID=3108223 RepID=A0ABU8XNI1_9PROT